MAVKIIIGYDDSEWKAVSDTFYNNFIPDDWDYIVIGKNIDEVDTICSRLYICDYKIVDINGEFWGVTYHA